MGKFSVKNFKKHFRSIFSPNQAISSNFGFLYFLTILSPPARRGTRSTPLGYCNGCFRQPMRTFSKNIFIAHALPVRRGARSTPRGYAPLKSSGNGYLRQPMQTFFYCDSHESQQRGKTPRVKILVNIFKNHFRSIFSPFRATLFFSIF